MTGVRLRPAQPEDHDEIVACVDAAYQGDIETHRSSEAGYNRIHYTRPIG